jgi:hypothetical protein
MYGKGLCKAYRPGFRWVPEGVGGITFPWIYIPPLYPPLRLRDETPRRGIRYPKIVETPRWGVWLLGHTTSPVEDAPAGHLYECDRVSPPYT